VRRLKKPQHLLLLLAADADAPADAELKTLLDVVSKNPAPRSSDDELMRTMAVRGEVCEGCQWLFDSQTLENDDGDTLPEPRYCGGGTFHMRKDCRVFILLSCRCRSLLPLPAPQPMQTHIESPGRFPYSEVHTRGHAL
jgi:hypothetical protein